MKTMLFNFLVTGVVVSLLFSGCKNKSEETGGQTSAKPLDQPEDSTGTAKITGPTDTIPKSTSVTLPVYALWVNHKENDRTFDGLYDRTSRRISLCEDNSEHDIEDTNEIVPNPNNGCYKKQVYAYHVILNTDSQFTIFINLLAFDSTHSQLIGIAPSGDTLIASFNHVEAAALEKMKYDLQNKSTEEKMQIMQHYQKPEMKKINNEKMKMNMYQKR